MWNLFFLTCLTNILGALISITLYNIYTIKKIRLFLCVQALVHIVPNEHPSLGENGGQSGSEWCGDRM
jgi:hypothetical protein